MGAIKSAIVIELNYAPKINGVETQKAYVA